MNKYVFWGIVAAISTLITVFGAWAKLTHQAYADKLLTIGLIMFAISQSVYAYLKFMGLKNKNDNK